MGKTIDLEASDGHLLGAYVAHPGAKVRGNLVVVQEAFGVTAYIRSVCDAYARDGYVSIAPALYDRQRRNAVFDDISLPAALEAGRRLRAGLEWPEVLLDVRAAIDAVKSPERRVGIVGFCVGGSVAWLAALSLPVAAASCYYGRDVVDFLQPPKCPVQLHFGERDPIIPLGDVERIRAALPDIPAWLYPAGHGFDGPGERHHAASAQLARERTLELFRLHVG